MILIIAWLFYIFAMYAVGVGVTGRVEFLQWPWEYQTVFVVAGIVGVFVIRLAKPKSKE